MGAPHDGFDHDRSNVDWFDRFTVEPASPTEIGRRLDGAALATLDIPDLLDRKLVAEVETGVALYRLVQLFGTPNVPVGVAGAPQSDRESTTWQYLFAVSFDAEGTDVDAPTEFLLSIYDYRTDVSVGLSAWADRGIGADRSGDEPAGEDGAGVRDPTGDPTGWPARIPDETFLVGLVELALNVTEEPVPATYKRLWV
jgi:hypothetical protein